MPERWISSITRGVLTAALLLAAALFPAAASACHPSSPTKVFWDEPPKAGPGEVVLQVRLLRTELEPGHSHITSLCGVPYAPKVSVFEILAVADGAFEPTQLTLIGWGYPSTAVWLVGTPRRLAFSTFRFTKPAEPPLPEPVSIEWRPPPCPNDYVCGAPPANMFKPY
jgi:hypothetical protein